MTGAGKGGRPPCEVRRAIERAAVELNAARGPVTWRELAVHAQVGYGVARRTVCNMERAGVLVRVGSQRPAHARRWMALYELAVLQTADAPRRKQQIDFAAALMREWAAAWPNVQPTKE